MEKIDLKKELKQFYKPSSKKIEIIDVPEFNYISLEGKGNPNNSSEFEEAIGALYAVAYTAKFSAKQENGMTDFVVMPLEGLWWAKDFEDFVLDNKDNWEWRLMIHMPGFITEDFINSNKAKAFEKKGLSGINDVKFEKYHEGISVQTLYIGPYSNEHETIKAMHDYAEGEGYDLDGLHHEIYLGDPRKVAPEKLKTVLRQPVKKK
ncbi:MAG: hypothetical protein SCALA702_03150 [Melioribacteraceae bacterium]|nr:MAG: hypothetical protein SCALA702_03150 [Melioribacteraceae bacterium]